MMDNGEAPESGTGPFNTRAQSRTKRRRQQKLSRCARNGENPFSRISMCECVCVGMNGVIDIVVLLSRSADDGDDEIGRQRAAALAREEVYVTANTSNFITRISFEGGFHLICIEMGAEWS